MIYRYAIYQHFRSPICRAARLAVAFEMKNEKIRSRLQAGDRAEPENLLLTHECRWSVFLLMRA